MKAKAEAVAQAHEVVRLVHELGALLHGRDPAVQSAALADLLAIWIAGHIVPGDPAATTVMRVDLLAKHGQLVRSLILPNSKAIHGC